MDKIMRSKLSFIAALPHWGAFLILTISAIGGSLTPSGFSLFTLVILTWLLSVGLTLQEKIPASHANSTRWFKVLLLYVFSYVAITKMFPNIEMNYLIPFHLLAVYGMLYALYFVSRSLVVAEEKQTLSFDRFLVTLFLFWFFPIGVWFVQPRVRKILKE